MSNDELSLALFIVKHRNDDRGSDVMRYCTDLHCDSTGKENKVKDKIVELMKYLGMTKAAEEFPSLLLPQFPVTGHDLVAHDLRKGPKFAATLSELRRIWKESSYTLTKEELCLQIPEVLQSLPENPKKMKKK